MLVDKAVRVIKSCQTVEQCDVAEAWVGRLEGKVLECNLEELRLLLLLKRRLVELEAAV